MSRVYDETVDAIAAAINQAAQAATQNLPYDISYQGVVKALNGNHRYTVTVEGKDYDVKALNQQVYEVGDRVMVQWPCSADHNKYILGSMSGSGLVAAATTSAGTIYGVILRADTPLIELTIDDKVYQGKPLAVGSDIEDDIYFIGTCGTPTQAEAADAANITVYTGSAVPDGYQIVLLIEGEVPTIDIPLLLIPAAALDESVTVMLSAEAPLEIITIDGVAYVGKRLDIEIDNQQATVLAGVSDIATAAQRDAAWKAGFFPYAGEEVPEGCDIFLIIKGVVPTIDIPIELTFANMDIETDTMTNPGFASDLTEGLQLCDISGNILTGTLPFVDRAVPVIRVDDKGVITAQTYQEAGRVAESGTETTTLAMRAQEARTITPTTTAQTAIGEGIYAIGDVVVEGDPNLIPENIRINTSIFGVEGALDQAVPELSIDENGLITAAAADKISEMQLETQETMTVTPNTVDQTILTPGIYTTGDIIVEGDPNLLPEYIKKDISIFGVEGEMLGVDLDFQQKVIAPSLEDQIITADEDYDALEQVTILAMPTAEQAVPTVTIDENGLVTAKSAQEEGYLLEGETVQTLQLPTQEITLIAPTLEEQIAVEAGTYVTDTILVEPMPTAEQAIPVITIIDTDDGGAAVYSQATQKAGYVERGTQTALYELNTVGSADGDTYYMPGNPGRCLVSAGQYAVGDICIYGDDNLQADNIVEGVSIFGVTGTATNIAEGTITGITTTLTVTGLGFTPNRVVLNVPNPTSSSTYRYVLSHLDTADPVDTYNCVMLRATSKYATTAVYSSYYTVTFDDDGFTVTVTTTTSGYYSYYITSDSSDIIEWMAFGPRNTASGLRQVGQTPDIEL